MLEVIRANSDKNLWVGIRWGSNQWLLLDGSYDKRWVLNWYKGEPRVVQVWRGQACVHVIAGTSQFDYHNCYVRNYQYRLVQTKYYPMYGLCEKEFIA